jgi:predicted DNA-binding transcriptional regulator AlpA
MNLLDIDEIAKLYRVSRRYARDILVKNPEFPQPVRGSVKKKPLWTEESIREFLSPKSRTGA